MRCACVLSEVNMMKAKIIVSALALVIAGQAQAQTPFSDVYLSVSGGTSWSQDYSGGAVLGPSSGGGFAGATQPFSIDFNRGHNFGGAIGMALPWSMRGEIEVTRYGIGVSEFKINDAKSTGEHGSVRTTTAMLNLYRDFDLGTVRPYIGAGIGWGRQGYDNVGGNVGGTANTLNSSTDGGAWQLLAGVAVPINSKLEFTVGYKYLDLSSVKASGAYVFGGGTGTETLSNVESTIQSVSAGFRFKF